MKLHPSLLNCAPVLFQVAALFHTAAASAATVVVDDWYAVNGGGAAIIVNGDTGSPQYQNVGLTTLDRVFSYFDPVTLQDGEKLTVSFTLTLELANPALTKTFNNFRFGLFTASTPHVTTLPTSYGPERTANTTTPLNAWRGFLLRDPAGNALRVYRKTGGGADGYATTTDADISTTVATTGNYNATFQDGVARTFSFSFERDGNDMLLTGSYGTGTFSGTVNGAFSGLGYDQFDAFGLYATVAGTDTNLIESAVFSNVSVHVVPEPSTLLLLSVAGVTALTFARRKRQTA